MRASAATKSTQENTSKFMLVDETAPTIHQTPSFSNTQSSAYGAGQVVGYCSQARRHPTLLGCISAMLPDSGPSDCSDGQVDAGTGDV